MSLLWTEETGLALTPRKKARRGGRALVVSTMLVSLFTRKMYELSLWQVFGLLTWRQLPLRDSVGLSPTFPLRVERPGSDTPET